MSTEDQKGAKFRADVEAEAGWVKQNWRWLRWILVAAGGALLLALVRCAL